MVYGYIRFSTSSQDEMQQKFALDEFAQKRGISIDSFEMDEGISGGVSYKSRKLYGLIKKMGSGDTLIVTEISRLGRSMGDVSDMLSKELKPRKIRLIVVKMGIDVDCSNLKATDEFLFSAMAFAAQVEKEMIVQRTQSAIDARKELLRKDGGFVSKTGRFCDHLGRRKGEKNPNAVDAMSKKRSETALDWKRRSPLYMMTSNMILKGEPRKKILQLAGDLYEQDPVAYGTRKGRPLSEAILSLWASEIIVRN